MFTNNNLRNRRIVAAATFAAASWTMVSVGFALPKRDVGQGHNKKTFEVRLVHPANVGSPGTELEFAL